jgi:adenosylcobinamide-GDP ribazoletransferase
MASVTQEHRRTVGNQRLEPLAGILAGALGGLVYWLAALLWPTSIAVVLSMVAVALATAAGNETGLADAVAALGAADSADAASDPGSDKSRRLVLGMLGLVFVLLTQYTALMALSAAMLPIPVPPNVALGLIMIAGHAAARALKVTTRPIHGMDLTVALAIGFAPAALLGIPGLVGLATAIVSRMVLGAWMKHRAGAAPAAFPGAVQQLSAVCFYLGALAAWTYI